MDSTSGNLSVALAGEEEADVPEPSGDWESAIVLGAGGSITTMHTMV